MIPRVQQNGKLLACDVGHQIGKLCTGARLKWVSAVRFLLGDAEEDFLYGRLTLSKPTPERVTNRWHEGPVHFRAAGIVLFDFLILGRG